eukprot:11740130-Ditylum_brightwellii.AAC.1
MAMELKTTEENVSKSDVDETITHDETITDETIIYDETVRYDKTIIYDETITYNDIITDDATKTHVTHHDGVPQTINQINDDRIDEVCELHDKNGSGGEEEEEAIEIIRKEEE